MRSALFDTGPVVGLLSARDEHHGATVAAIRTSANQGRSLCTIWEVIGEAYTLIRMRVAAPESAGPALLVLRWARESGITVLSTIEADHLRAAALLEQYHDHRLSYVDALLLSVAERHQVEEVVTVDARHFQAVRLHPQPTITVV